MKWLERSKHPVVLLAHPMTPASKRSLSSRLTHVCQWPGVHKNMPHLFVQTHLNQVPTTAGEISLSLNSLQNLRALHIDLPEWSTAASGSYWKAQQCCTCCRSSVVSLWLRALFPPRGRGRPSGLSRRDKSTRAISCLHQPPSERGLRRFWKGTWGSCSQLKREELEDMAPQVRFADINLQIRRGDENREEAGEVGEAGGRSLLERLSERRRAMWCPAELAPQWVEPFLVQYIAAIKRVFMRLISYLEPAQRLGGCNNAHHTYWWCETIPHSVSRGGVDQTRPSSAGLSHVLEPSPNDAWHVDTGPCVATELQQRHPRERVGGRMSHSSDKDANRAGVHRNPVIRADLWRCQNALGKKGKKRKEEAKQDMTLCSLNGWEFNSLADMKLQIVLNYVRCDAVDAIVAHRGEIETFFLKLTRVLRQTASAMSVTNLNAPASRLRRPSGDGLTAALHHITDQWNLGRQRKKIPMHTRCHKLALLYHKSAGGPPCCPTTPGSAWDHL